MGLLEETLLAEAHRQLDGQLSELDGLRSRAVSVLGAAGVVAGLFVGRLDSNIDGFAWAALGLLLSTVVAAVWVILPRQLASAQDLRSALAWYERYRNRPDSDDVFIMSATRNLQTDWSTNRPVLRQLGLVFSAECGLLGLQLLMWVLSAASR